MVWNKDLRAQRQLFHKTVLVNTLTELLKKKTETSIKCYLQKKYWDKLTERTSSSKLDIILEESSSQHKFSSAVATKAAQRANALYNSDQVLSKVFMVA